MTKKNKRYAMIIIAVLLLLSISTNEAFVQITMKTPGRTSSPITMRVTTPPPRPTAAKQSPLWKLAWPFYDSKRRAGGTLYATTDSDVEQKSKKAEQKQQEEEQPLLSEMDARVLRSMLTDDKLDLDTEENMRKLLERGVAPKTPDKPEPIQKEEEYEGEYVSTVLKTLSDTKAWKALKAKAGDAWESVQIFVANRIERDVKLLASVGIFAWDRVKKDVARALPASGRSGAKMGRAMKMAVRQLANTSSFDENNIKSFLGDEEDLDLYEELNTPMDEIRSVTQSIRDILSGEPVDGVSSSSGRGLRTVAPPGQGQNTERQRRAYKRRKETVLKREQERLDQKLGRAAGGVVDTAWEMKREMQVEVNKPGYRTETVRNAIEAGATETAKAIKAAKEPGGWKRILFGKPKDKKPELGATDPTKVAAVDADVTKVAAADADAARVTAELNLEADLLEERSRVASRLRVCLERPEDTWLNPDVLTASDDEGPIVIDDNDLLEVVATMICTRDDLEGAVDAGDTDDSVEIEDALDELQCMKSSIETITSLAAVAAGYSAAESLSSFLYGTDEVGEERPLLLRLDEIDTEMTSVQVPDECSVSESLSANDVPKAKAENIWFANVVDASNDNADDVLGETSEDAVDAVVVPNVVTASVVDADLIEVHDATVAEVEMEVETSDSVSSDSLAVEIVSDEDFDEAFGVAKAVSSVSGDELEADEDSDEKEPNIFVQLTLRTLDVVFFVAEKILTVGLPGVFKVGKTASTRIGQVSRDGLGSKGWKKLGNVKDGKKRY